MVSNISNQSSNFNIYIKASSHRLRGYQLCGCGLACGQPTSTARTCNTSTLWVWAESDTISLWTIDYGAIPECGQVAQYF